MKRKIAKWSLIGLAALAGLVSALPANWLSVPVSRVSGGHWDVSQAKGTLWDGGAQLVYLGAGGEVQAMSPIAWQWQPKALMSGLLVWHLDSAGQPGMLQLGWGKQEVRGLALSLPMAALANLSKTWQAARLGGEVQVNVPQLARQGKALSGNVQLAWRGAASPLTTALPFGSYQLDIAGTPQGASLTLSTLEGPLMLNGQGSVSPQGVFQMAGSGESPPDKYDALKPLMLMLGQPSGPTGINWQIKPGM
ncbi:type II secretion system protein N [Chromobacterium sp. IIBBL 290-4]|uniref:type II secretion system protein N n=1 Tax=Chromobacterium sp. IIBBL 290-4 TaxID=2953890 RepID=UPI0020B6C974|nr:type II secretion system protein N [Chromobacterium sp. IIBBL 290-4]UTH72286.1 type II secretion system protein N [Chromobacterium sp. IIBBL 290-4]